MTAAELERKRKAGTPDFTDVFEGQLRIAKVSYPTKSSETTGFVWSCQMPFNCGYEQMEEMRMFQSYIHPDIWISEQL